MVKIDIVIPNALMQSQAGPATWEKPLIAGYGELSRFAAMAQTLRSVSARAAVKL